MKSKQVLGVVASYYREPLHLVQLSRRYRYTRMRHIAAWLARHSGESLQAVAKGLGYRDHSGAVRAVQTVDAHYSKHAMDVLQLARLIEAVQ